MDATAKNLLNLQREEATLCEVYRRLAELEKDPVRRQTLVRIMHDERRHCAILKRRTGREMAPDPKRVFWYVWIMRVLGPAFVVRQMELCEKGTEASYSLYAEREEFIRIASEEKRHRGGSDQPGRRNAAVLYEFGGIGPERRSGRIHGGAGRVHACAERTAARGAYGQHHRCRRRPFDGRFRIPFDQIGRYGEKHPLRAALCTGTAYLVTVAILIIPYLLFSNAVMALSVMLLAALTVIALFNYYYAVVRSESFRQRFFEMALLSFGIAGISFLIGYGLKYFTGIEM